MQCNEHWGLVFIDYKDYEYEYYQSNTSPVTISHPFSFGEDRKPQSVLVGDTVADIITLVNDKAVDVILDFVTIHASDPEDSFTLSRMEPPSKNSNDEYKQRFEEYTTIMHDVFVPARGSRTLWLSCKPKELGLHAAVVLLVRDNDRTERVVFVLAEDEISQSLSTAKKPFSRLTTGKEAFFYDDDDDDDAPVHPAWTTNGHRNTSRHVWYPPASKLKHWLPWYRIPDDIREIVMSKQIPNAVREGLTRSNYNSYFKNLLIMEEIQLKEEMRAYDMDCVDMRKRGTHNLTLQIPGLAERRPSLVHGDYVYVKCAATDDANHTSFSYQGYVHCVGVDEVYLRFSPKFHSHHRQGDLFNVQFTYNRLNMRRLYQAVDAASELETEFLFPSESSQMRQIATTPLMPISCILNKEQIFSVEMILGCKGGLPYVIYGPSGTGKTMTLVETILQLYKNRKDARILVSAASNNAADLILEKVLCEKAVFVHKNEILRLNATSRPYENVKPDHIPFCFLEKFTFKCPPPKDLMRYRIIVSTYMSASYLYAEGVQKGHFSHIFLDEAGQVSEPETMVPLSNLSQRETVVVLSGDPMQLGPVIYSKDAESYRLGASYLERLFKFDFYKNTDENHVTKLIRNYGCHPEILHLSSKLFYHGELIACKYDTSSSMPWVNLLPNKEFPVLFIGVQGCDEQEDNTPSWFNRFEASKIVEIVKKLTASRNLYEEDIGVITPYRQQALKIKAALGRLDMSDIAVGSVEQFRGQEKQVIIISSVRSTMKHDEVDRCFCRGFWNNPRMFNVAITCARSMLIFVGNPHIVNKDPYWSKLLWRCSDNESYLGCCLPKKRQDHDDSKEEVNCSQ